MVCSVVHRHGASAVAGKEVGTCTVHEPHGALKMAVSHGSMERRAARVITHPNNAPLSVKELQASKVAKCCKHELGGGEERKREGESWHVILESRRCALRSLWCAKQHSIERCSVSRCVE